MFSIIIPSWNNKEYLQLCVESILRNSAFAHQVIVYVNDGSDGTHEWIKARNIDHIHSPKNEGICIAVNACRSLVRHDYIVYMNDDMYVCPGWDTELKKVIEKIGHHKFMLSSTLIEPREVNNSSYVSIVKDFGDSVAGFREAELLSSYGGLAMENWYGASWPPSVVSTKLWDIVGGYSIEFSPGMYSDPDFSMKLWKYGVRMFMGVGASKVYHFQSKSTNKIKKNKGNDTFLFKWGITARTFYRHSLKMGQKYNGELTDESLPRGLVVKNKLKKIVKNLFH